MIEYVDLMDPDEQLYEAAAKELASSPRTGLLAKCMAKCNGDENKAKAMYIELRVEMLKENLGIPKAKVLMPLGPTAIIRKLLLISNYGVMLFIALMLGGTGIMNYMNTLNKIDDLKTEFQELEHRLAQLDESESDPPLESEAQSQIEVLKLQLSNMDLQDHLHLVVEPSKKEEMYYYLSSIIGCLLVALFLHKIINWIFTPTKESLS